MSTELTNHEFFSRSPQVVYIIIAIAAWFYPNPDVATSNDFDGSGGGGIMPIAGPIGTLVGAAAQATQAVVEQLIVSAQQVVPLVAEL